MLNEIYNARILELAGNIPLCKRLSDAESTSSKHSKLCGSKVTVDLNFVDGIVVQYGQEVKACALGQAACSIMARNVVGSNGQELYALRDQVYAMLKDGGAPPEGKWADIAALQPVKDFKARHPSTMLVFEAVCEIINRMQANVDSKTNKSGKLEHE